MQQMVTYEYRFARKAPIEAVRETLVLALVAAESLHGRAKVRLESQFHLDGEQRRCFVEASRGVGEDIARLFTGFLGREFGEETFTVRQIEHCNPRRRKRQRGRRGEQRRR